MLSAKRRMTRQLYLAKTYDRAGLQKLLSVSAGTLSNWLSDIDKAEREERKRKIQDLYLACYTAEEISEQVGIAARTVSDELDTLSDGFFRFEISAESLIFRRRFYAAALQRLDILKED